MHVYMFLKGPRRRKQLCTEGTAVWHTSAISFIMKSKNIGLGRGFSAECSLKCACKDIFDLNALAHCEQLFFLYAFIGNPSKP